MPFYRFQIDSPLSQTEAAKRVEAITRPKPKFLESIGSIFSPTNESQPFVGKVELNSFQIQREINYRNSFLPQIRGEILPLQKGSRVTVRMFMHPLVTVFMLVWFSFFFFSVATMPATKVALGPSTVPFPVIMLVLGIGLVAIGFVPEVVKARRILVRSIGTVGT